MSNFDELKNDGLFPASFEDLEDLGVEDVEPGDFENWVQDLAALPEELVRRIRDNATSNFQKLVYAGLLVVENEGDGGDDDDDGFTEGSMFGDKTAGQWINALSPKLVRELILASSRVRGTGGHLRS